MAVGTAGALKYLNIIMSKFFEHVIIFVLYTGSRNLVAMYIFF